jgi:nucleoside 2-deoxyribosyltransferase
MITVYLAGAIRDDHPEDIEWRESAITALAEADTLILNPLGGKTYNTKTKKWLCHGEPAGAISIVKHDFWCVDRADAVIFNLLSLADGYPTIGSLVEFGRATARGLLIYSIVPTGFTGHENGSMFAGLHPFIEQNSAKLFTSVTDCIEFARLHFPVMAGYAPRFVGKVI